jgi:hypothetical protein
LLPKTTKRITGSTAPAAPGHERLAAAPNVFLLGGTSAYLTEDVRVRHLPDVHAPFKILAGNCWEHFEPTDRTTRLSERVLRVFVWTRSTRVAE